LLVVVWAALMLPTTKPSSLPLLAVMVGAGLIVLARGPAAPIYYDLATPFSFLFAGVGLLYVTLSALHALPTTPERPIRIEYIPRHSYFLVLWVPAVAGITELFRHLIPDLIRLVKRAGLAPLIIIGGGDFLLTLVFGGQGYFYAGYEAFFEPATVTALYCACFFLYVSVTRKIGWPLFFITANYFIENHYNLGMMFNTLTGAYILAMAWVFSLTIRRSPHLAFVCTLLAALALFATLIVGVIAPNLLDYKGDTLWRALVWRENLATALNSSLIGVGFGAPYFPLNTENIAEAFRLATTPDFLAHGVGEGSPIDILYVRGQHSSYVNAFYRMGVLGGGLLIAFNFAVLSVAWQAVRKGRSDLQALAAGCAAIFLVGISLLAMHVALETVRFFAMFMLSVGLCRAAAHHARIAQFKPVRDIASVNNATT
jgi:hypothetical protein